MFTTIIRVLIIYLVVLFFLRIMGKRQIGEMQPFELVITLIIADLATIPMSDSGIPLINGVLPLAILVVVHFVLTFLSRKSIFVRNLLSGSPAIVIDSEGISYNKIKSLNMTVDDLQETLRSCGYYNFDQVQFAIIETNGKMSVIPKSTSCPVTAGDLKINNPPTQIPYLIVSDGQINKPVLIESGRPKQIIDDILNSKNISTIKNIIALSLDANNNVYLQQKGKKFVTFVYGGK